MIPDGRGYDSDSHRSNAFRKSLTPDLLAPITSAIFVQSVVLDNDVFIIEHTLPPHNDVFTVLTV